MRTCESYEMHISALLDGEADREDTLSVLEHLPTCDSCQSFFSGARELQDLADAQPVSGEAIERTESQSPHPTQRAVVTRLSSAPRWAWAIAAALLVAVAFWVRPAVTPPNDAVGDPRASITLDENSSEMTEARFVEMAVELLESDQRYQTEMLGILLRLERSRVVEEGSAELASNHGESMLFWDFGLEVADEEVGTEGDFQVGIY